MPWTREGYERLGKIKSTASACYSFCCFTCGKEILNVWGTKGYPPVKSCCEKEMHRTLAKKGE